VSISPDWLQSTSIIRHMPARTSASTLHPSPAWPPILDGSSV
jgi:hypothetical protein